MAKILKSAIRIGGKIYTAKHHDEAIAKAFKDGKDVSKVDKEKEGLFLVSDGRFITREKARKEFGITHSGQLFKDEKSSTIQKPIEKSMFDTPKNNDEMSLKGDEKSSTVIESSTKGAVKGRKFVIVTTDFSGLGWGLDKINENDQILFATNPDMEKLKEKGEEKELSNIGKGLISRLTLKDVMDGRSKLKDWYWIFDNNNSVEENEILRKEGFKVCLGGQISYDLENDREKAIKLSEKYGIPSPEWKAFTSPEEGIKFLEANEGKAYVCKPNGSESYLTTVPRLHDPKKANENMRIFIKSMGFKDYILQEMKKGIEVNLDCYFVKGEPKSVSLGLECKRVSSDDTGSMVGCSFDVVKDIPLDSKIVKMTIGKMFPYYKEKNITGFGDINCIIGDSDIWFIEKCERLGYNYHINYFKNIEKKDALNTLADMCDGTYKPETRRIWGATITTFVDYPHEGIPMQIPEDIKDKVYLMDGMVKDGVLVQTGIHSGNNELAVVCGSDYEIKGAFQDALDKCEKLRDEIVNLDFRKDAIRDDYDSSPIKRYRALCEMGVL